MIYVFLANGFEEIEALAPVNIMRRAGLEVTTVGIGGRVVNGAHDIMVTADINEDQVRDSGFQAIMLPGGGVGTENLDGSELVHSMIDSCVAKGLLIGAICAAPSILGKRGLLKGKKATAFPQFQQYLQGAELSSEGVCRDGNIITAKGMGVSIEFGAAMVEYLCSPKKAAEVLEQIQYQG